MNEHRKVLRHRVLKAGTISIKRAGTIGCMVRNISGAGACFDVASPLGIPEDFILVTGDEQIQHSCHVIWRAGKRIGVAFK